MNLYEELGIDKNADGPTIKKAYRQAASKHHPDRDGGSHDKFVRVQKAYDTLSNDESRAHYDATGEETKRQGPSIQEIVAQLFVQIVAQLDTQYQDPVKELKANLKKQLDSTYGVIPDIMDECAKWRHVARRTSISMLRELAKDRRKTALQKYLSLRQVRNTMHAAIELVATWDYTVDQQPVAVPTSMQELYAVYMNQQGTRNTAGGIFGGSW